MTSPVRSSFTTWLKVLIVLGTIGVLVSTAWFIHIQQFLVSAMTTQGSVSRIVAEYDGEGDITYTPEIQFKDQAGQMHTIRTFISGNEEDHYIGEPIPVLYSPQNPAQATVGTFWEIYIGCIILLILSLAALISGGVTSILLKQEEKRKQELVANGQKIEATITNINYLTSITKHGRSPWLITAEWTNPVNNQKYDFGSDLLWVEPTGYTKDGKITVYIDAQNPEQYVMDVPSHLD